MCVVYVTAQCDKYVAFSFENSSEEMNKVTTGWMGTPQLEQHKSPSAFHIYTSLPDAVFLEVTIWNDLSPAYLAVCYYSTNNHDNGETEISFVALREMVGLYAVMFWLSIQSSPCADLDTDKAEMFYNTWSKLRQVGICVFEIM